MKDFSIKMCVSLLIMLAILGVASKVNAVTFYEVKKDVNMRSQASTKGTIYAELKKGEEVVLVQKGNWHKVTYEEEGYVANKYHKFSNGKSCADIDKCYEIKINQEGTINGYLGIDVSTGCAIKAKAFEKLISGEKKISGNTIYENNLCDFKPAFVYLKFGATGWGDSFSIANSTTPDDVVEFIKLCEKYEIPYGGYYYTQCVSKEEADKEVEYIQDIFNKAEKEIGKLKYHKLPFAIDIENPAKRMGKFVKGTGSKAKLTEVKNYMINQVRIIDEVDDIIVYTDRNALRELINFKNLDQKNQDLWMVDPISCDTHSKDIVNLGYMDYIDIRQIRLDYRMSGIGTMDINLMNKDVFEKLTK